jgi:3-hydroxyacyl-CoA dehydrogenase
MRVKRATVIGAGVMGSAIAAHLANAGVPTSLLDVVPAELTDEDRRRGLTPTHPDVRNRLASTGRERALRASPPAFMVPELASLVTPGNVDDDLHRVQESDWVIEAIVEDLAAKRALFEQVERHWRPGIIVSSNTSGLSVTAMVEGRSQAFREHFLGTHFFNPPRYMHLVEIIPAADTRPETVTAARGVIGRMLGKGIVTARDTPNFIANRIGAFTSCLAVKLAIDEGYTVEEVDALTGPLIDRPRTATFRLADLVGLDTAYNVRRHVYESLSHDPDREVFTPPASLRTLVERGWLGAKTGRGFYWRQGETTLVIDLKTLEYRPQQASPFPSLERIGKIEQIGERIGELLRVRDRAATFVWQLLGRTLVYAARVVPEISDDVVNVDRAMRWGFHWDLGPFELWDALGPADVAARLAAEGMAIPPVVERVLRQGPGRFYRTLDGRRQFFDFRAAAYQPIPSEDGVPDHADPARDGRRIEHTADASLLDIGDGVACVELHSKLNTIGPETVRMLDVALDRLEREFEALVIATQARDFSAGADLRWLLAAAEEGNWHGLDRAVRSFQQVVQRIRRAPKPVVGAATGRTLAAGAEICLACARVQAAAETYMGLVEPRVGLIPAGGGTMEMVKRAQAGIPSAVAADLLPLVGWAFETIARARTSQSALEARRLGYLRESDGITMNAHRLMQDAKEAALAMARLTSRPPLASPIRVGGDRVRSALRAMLYILKTGGHITAHDEVVGQRLAHVMAGGDVPEGTWVSEEYLLDLEREAFLGLLGEGKTRDRIRHTLQTGKPLQN